MSGRDILITVQAFDAASRNAFNEPVGQWQTFCRVWARRVDLTDAEKIANGEEGSAMTARFTVRSNSKTRAVTGDHRIRTTDGAIWNIKGARPSEIGRNRSVELTAVRASDRSAGT